MTTLRRRITGMTMLLIATVLLGVAFVILTLAYRAQGRDADRTKAALHQTTQALKRTELIVKQNQLAADHRWCHLLRLVKSPPAPPPKTNAGRHFNDAVVQLFKDFDCG